MESPSLESFMNWLARDGLGEYLKHFNSALLVINILLALQQIVLQCQQDPGTFGLAIAQTSLHVYKSEWLKTTCAICNIYFKRHNSSNNHRKA